MFRGFPEWPIYILMILLALFFSVLVIKAVYAVLHQLDQKIIYPHYDFKHLTEKYFEIGMKLNDFSIQLVKYWYDPGSNFSLGIIAK